MHHGHTRRCVVTAPDPGLTDLIAAHTTNWERRCLGGDESYLQCDCGDEFEDELSWAAHLKLVVEQHTNGRIAELEAALRSVDDLIVLVLREEERKDRPSSGTVKAITYSRNYIRAALEGGNSNEREQN